MSVLLQRVGLLETVAAGGGFSPDDLAGLKAWHDPSDLSTLLKTVSPDVPVSADGDSIARIMDKTANDNNFGQGTAANRAVYKTSGGLHFIRFDGVDDFYGMVDDAGAGKSLTFTGEFMIIAGIRYDAGEANQSLFLHGATGASEAKYGIIDASTRDYFFRPVNANASAIDVDVASHVGSARVFSAGRNASDLVVGRLNGVQVGSITQSGNSVWGTLGGFGQPFGGDLFGLIMVEGFDQTDLENAESWMADKSGVTL